MEAIADVAKWVVLVPLVVIFIYIATRAVGVAWFRSRKEYDSKDKGD